MADIDHGYGHSYTSYKGLAGVGAGFGIAGTALGLMNGGLNLLGGCGNGWGRNGWSNGYGYGNCGGYGYGFPASQFDLAMQNEIASKDATIGSLCADRNTDNKIIEVYKYFDSQNKELSQYLTQNEVRLARLEGMISQVAQQGCVTAQTLSGLTKVVIPTESICPRPMDRFNSWVAPTAVAPAEENNRVVSA